MKFRYIGQPNHTILELVSAKVLSAGESLQKGQVYDIPAELERGIMETGWFVKQTNEKKKKGDD